FGYRPDYPVENQMYFEGNKSDSPMDGAPQGDGRNKKSPDGAIRGARRAPTKLSSRDFPIV
ncbi:MAG TPA: hypothetical protein PK442_09645, partial [Synergistales bacterium]|nr:hypothetical protein [Synergistales bacterium]